MARPSYAGYYNNRTEQDADEDEEELVDFEASSTRDMILFLIDAGPKMHDTLVPLGGEDPTQAGKLVSLFHKALNTAFLVQRNKLVTAPADQCGILLFNTKESKLQDAGKNAAHPNCYTIQSILQVSVPPVSELKDDLQDSLDNGPSFFRQKYAPAEKQSRIDYAFSNADAMILQLGKAGKKRCFFITNEDNPMEEKKGKDQRRLALEKVNSMTKRGIEFLPFLLSTPEKDFDPLPFYGVVFNSYDDDQDDPFLAISGEIDGHTPLQQLTATSLDVFETEVLDRESPKRVIFSVPMFIGSELTLGVKGYCTLIKASKGLPVKVKAMDREDEDDPIVYKEVITETSLACADTGRELDKDRDIDAAFNFGSESSLRSKVRFTKSEVKALRTFGQLPSIRILGFKPISALRFYENVKHAYFIYPSDEQWQNSERAFSALLKSMASKEKFAIALFCPRANVIPTFAAILPHEEDRQDDRGGQVEPPGMYVIPLPYADDIREPPERHRNPELLANEEQVAAAREFINGYGSKGPFNPDVFGNPSLEYHYKVLLAVAFGDDIPSSDSIKDSTLPNYARINRQVGDFIQSWNRFIANDPRLASRRAAIEGSSSSTKRSASTAGFTSNDEPELKKLHAEGILGAKTTVEKLKAICQYYRLSSSGKKAELLERVSSHLNKLNQFEEKDSKPEIKSEVKIEND